MIIRTIQYGFVAGALIGAGFVIGCSSDDSSSTSSSPQSFGDLAAEIDAPTGTVDATSVGPVAEEFESAMSSAMSGTRQVQDTQDMSASVCTSGGSAIASGSGSESSGTVRVNYSSCCVAEGCCVDGTADTAYNSDSTGTAAYSN